jgi:nucleotide-binding universal stress UspA family protein
MYTHIVVPLDGSELAETAIEPAIKLASAFGAKVTLVRVAMTPQLRATSFMTGLPDAADLYLTLQQQIVVEVSAYLEAQAEKWQAAPVDLAVKMIEGAPVAERLLTLIEALDADLIVMNTHGRSGVSRWLLGSVAEQVVRGADIPVLLLRTKGE